MSHFSVYVLVKKAEEKQVAAVLAPYDENKTVRSYETDCYCVGQEAEGAARAAVEAEQSLDSLRASFRIAHPLPPGCKSEWDRPHKDEEARTELWRKYTAAYFGRVEELTKAHARYDMPNSSCGNCNGTGKYKTTYNPKSKWDWYAIGGRWAGTFRNMPRPSSFDEVYKDRRINDEYLKVRDLLAGWAEDMTPFAVLAPEEGWVERGQMGWWACVSNEKKRSDWEQEVKALLAKYPDLYAVNVDCHI
jgi:hypothetical protein